MSREEGLIAIDIGARGVKVAQVVTRGNRIVEIRRGSAALPEGFVWVAEGDSTPVASALTEALLKAGVKGRRAVCILPRHQVTLRFTEFPSARHEELLKMAALEAEQHIPLPPAETVVGCQALSSTPGANGLFPSVIAATRKTVVQGYVALLSSLGLQAEQMTVDALCLFALWGAEAPDNSPAFLLDLGAKGMVINLVESGLLRMSRAVPGGGDELTRAFQKDFRLSPEEAEKAKQSRGLDLPPEMNAPEVNAWFNVIVSEIRRSVMAFGTLAGQTTRIYLCGGTALLPGLKPRLEAALGMRVSFLVPPQNLLPASEGALYSLAAAASQDAAHRTGALNLILPETAAEDRQLRRKRTWSAVALGAVITLLFFLFGSYALLRSREARLQETAADWKEATRTLQTAAQLSATRAGLLIQIDQLSAALESRQQALDLLLELHTRAPKKIWLTSLVLEKTPPVKGQQSYTLQLTGKAPDNSVVADLVSALSHIPKQTVVNLQSAKSVTYEDKPIVEFSLSCQFLGHLTPAVKLAPEKGKNK